MLTVGEKTKRTRKELLKHGYRIENEVVTTPQGVKIDISDVPREALANTKGIFLNEAYAISSTRDAVLIDIGFNLGIVSLFFAGYPNVRKIYAYEPFKPTFELAKKNLKLNSQLSEKIIAFNFGLGKADETLELPYSDASTGSMSTTHDVCKGKEDNRKETVVIRDAARELTSILKEHKNRRIIVKCNCEGAEFEIFERFDEENLIGNIDVILMSYHFNKPDGLVDVLTRNGFAVSREVLSENENKGHIHAVRMAGK